MPSPHYLLSSQSLLEKDSQTIKGWNESGFLSLSCVPRAPDFPHTSLASEVNGAVINYDVGICVCAHVVYSLCGMYAWCACVVCMCDVLVCYACVSGVCTCVVCMCV